MSWPVRFDPQRIQLYGEERGNGVPAEAEVITRPQAQRQEVTVREILARLQRQPGLVLADEVGMGKTYVALAVAASVAWADSKRRPVVIMVPSSLKEKWPIEVDTFVSRCLRRETDREEIKRRTRRARNGVEFFGLLDDDARTRPRIILLTHGALHNALTEPLVKLAILRQALAPVRYAAQRKALPRFAGEILYGGRKYPEDLFESLLHRSPGHWRAILADWNRDPGDDPVPHAIATVLKRNRVDLRDLRQRLWDLPLRDSQNREQRVSRVRKALNKTIQDVWRQALIQARFRSPLLILDEAHHLKNPATRLASLFVEPEAKEDASLLEGALSGSFERILFLTATPFQLDHGELLNVLDRFRGICWKPGSPTMSEDDFDAAWERLSAALQKAYFASTRLDRRWGQLRDGDFDGVATAPGSDTWWQSVRTNLEAQSERIQTAFRSFCDAGAAMREAESLLRPWVIRHLRPRKLKGRDEERRIVLCGAAIEKSEPATKETMGITVREQALLPFLLAARSQAIVARGAAAQTERALRRATFAEGLASSYEAFLETRRNSQRNGSKRVVSDEDPDLPNDTLVSPGSSLAWYLNRLQAALPSPEQYAGHPKIEPTVKRACDIWEAGEKVLVFCHYKATGTALASHISAALSARIRRRAAAAIGCRESKVDHELELLGNRFEPNRPLYSVLEKTVRDLLDPYDVFTPEERDDIFDVIRRFVRTPSFLIRFFPVAARDINTAFAEALQREDGSGLSLMQRLRGFADLLAYRCQAELRASYLTALKEMRTGVRYGRKRPDEAEDPIALQPTVRRATGDDGFEERQRSLRGFNSPFFPEILVASSVLAEGVDLQLDCRHVIHHDLCWNPSTLEQRTGRIDRIGAKADRAGRPILVYLPYIAETQDEKMYRVVRDRERWFQVVMGGEYVVDESVTDKAALRVPLPEAAAAELAFRLEVWRETGNQAVVEPVHAVVQADVSASAETGDEGVSEAGVEPPADVRVEAGTVATEPTPEADFGAGEEGGARSAVEAEVVESAVYDPTPDDEEGDRGPHA